MRVPADRLGEGRKFDGVLLRVAREEILHLGPEDGVDLRAVTRLGRRRQGLHGILGRREIALGRRGGVGKEARGRRTGEEGEDRKVPHGT